MYGDCYFEILKILYNEILDKERNSFLFPIVKQLISDFVITEEQKNVAVSIETDKEHNEPIFSNLITTKDISLLPSFKRKSEITFRNFLRDAAFLIR